MIRISCILLLIGIALVASDVINISKTQSKDVNEKLTATSSKELAQRRLVAYRTLEYEKLRDLQVAQDK